MYNIVKYFKFKSTITMIEQNKLGAPTVRISIDLIIVDERQHIYQLIN